jgi:4'-phosphopantetheinyl transferase
MKESPNFSWEWQSRTTGRGEHVLNEGEVHVWLAEHDAGRLLRARDIEVLSGEERERSTRLRFVEHQVRFVQRRRFLRTVLGEYLGTEPQRVEIETDSYGKPHIRGEALLSFNLSHSGNLSLLALGKGKKLGIDIERIDRTVNVDEVSRRFFSPREVEEIFGLPSELRELAFFVCWSRKEAFVKAVGRGFSFPLDRFSVSCRPGEPAALLDCGDEEKELVRWVLLDLPPIPGNVTALAGELPISKVICRRWSTRPTRVSIEQSD